VEALLFVLAFPLAGSLALAFIGHRDLARDVNVAFSAATFTAACALTARVVSSGPLLAFSDEFFIDPLNVFLVTLTAFVGLTTSIFSRPYMRVEQDHGTMTPARMRLYHSMYQLFSFTMLVALTTSNMGILWVAMEAATLTTVLLVSVYRTAASLRGSVEVLHLCGVGIALALFGTVLLYCAGGEDLRRRGRSAPVDAPTAPKAASIRTSSRSRSPSSSSATARRSGWCRSTTGCPTRMPKGRRRSRPCSPGCSSTSRCTRCCAARSSPTARCTTRSRDSC
jgi:formate hydrogenlyase subunit 3/multisubunit Na+/H+ antiporter MnhD subunit